MRAERLLLASLIAAVALPAAPDAGACGPDFPVELLSDRASALAELPEGIFVDEVARLVPAPGDYPVVIGNGGDGDPSSATPLGNGPGDRELALYQRGADAFHAGDRAAARRAFEALLRLPPGQRQQRSTWAAYMLGRLDPDRADFYFPLVRSQVDSGFIDERGLAAASFGEQALAHRGLEQLRLYALQAALGDPTGTTSLLLVVRAIVDRGGEDEILGDPLGQRLIAIYLYTRDDELTVEQRARLWTALAAIPHPAGADRLAAAAYRAGQWDDAARLVAGAEDSEVSRWVRAKLALRAGDRAGADRLLRGAADLFPDDAGADTGYVDMSRYATRARLEGDRALLALADGRATDAMTAAWAARRVFRDASYLAERVLTIAELRAFVDALDDDDDDDDDNGGEDEWGAINRDSLRALLGRRLMRAGRVDEALPYLPRAVRGDAIGLGAMLDAAGATGDPVDQARALYQASTIARIAGLELLGTEHAPDWAAYGAEYDLSWTPAPPGAWLGPDERARVRASAPAFLQRYHYRYLASQLAEQAADRLPHESQAFAATLCWSARYVFFTDPDRVQRLYHRYVADGPGAVSMDFGQTCPEPEFERARRFTAPPPSTRWQLALPFLALGAIAAALAAVAVTRRRQRRFAARP